MANFSTLSPSESAPERAIPAVHYQANYSGLRIMTVLKIIPLRLALNACAAGDAPGTHALFDLTTPRTALFPSDNFTVSDPSQLKGLRVANRAGTAWRTTTRFCPPRRPGALKSGNSPVRQGADSAAYRRTK